ncbi:hypothetical protein GVO57_07045 [Sphingomonas changnyeongensis]|uniref:Uncharacterized protein n=1 Tax=Sphingomonas changnyeongensis TaxID=2698679 RepID=A0A7Z2S509_9SPHN|nr:hypothetical protein [Sphingomonas changnyeongensis]QHL90630.1 hypothetical protein GVO57_07045 [Sphingomonas changnyeongensis]
MRLALVPLWLAAFVPAAAPAATPAAVAAAVDLGRCVAKADRSAALDLMRTLPLGDEPVDPAALALGRGGACATGVTGPVSAILVRGGVADDMFARDFVEFGVQPRRVIADLARIDLPTALGPGGEGASADVRALYLVAECVARSSPTRAEQLMKTAPGSSGEMRVMEALTPLMQACHRTAAPIAFGRGAMRAAITQAAYHVSARYWAGEMTLAGQAQGR